MSRVRSIRCSVLIVFLAALSVGDRPSVASAHRGPVVYTKMLTQDQGPPVGDIFSWTNQELQLTFTLFDEQTPKLSPNGTQIAYSSNAGGTRHIRMMNADGSNQHPITTSGSWAAWSPDGNKIAFSMNGDIYTVAPNGTNLTRLTNTPWEEDQAAWGPGFIAYTSYQFGVPEIFTMLDTGLNQTRLTNNTGFDIEAAWSQDGSKIYWATDRAGGVFHIWSMTPSGQAQIDLTPWSTRNVAAPFSCADAIVAQTQFFGDIWTILFMRANGSQPENPLPPTPDQRHKPSLRCGAPTFVNQVTVKKVGFHLGPESPTNVGGAIDAMYQAFLHRDSNPNRPPESTSTFRLGQASLPTSRWTRSDAAATSVGSAPHALVMYYELVLSRPLGDQTITYRNRSPACPSPSGDSMCRWNLADGIRQTCVNTVCFDPAGSPRQAIQGVCRTLPVACQQGGQVEVRTEVLRSQVQVTVPLSPPAPPQQFTLAPGYVHGGGAPTANPPIVGLATIGANGLLVSGTARGYTVVQVHVLHLGTNKSEWWAVGVTVS